MRKYKTLIVTVLSIVGLILGVNKGLDWYDSYTAYTELPRLELVAQVINADEVVANLPLRNKQTAKSDNGRVRQRWDIVFDSPNNVPQRLEAIGNNQQDADLLGWPCQTFDGAGNLESAQQPNHFCHKLFKSVLAKFIKTPEVAAAHLIKKSEIKGGDEFLDAGDFRFEVGKGFYFVRRISRKDAGS